MNTRVSVIFEKPQDFIEFYHRGLPRFTQDLPMSQPPSLLEDDISDLDEDESEDDAKLITVMEIPEVHRAAFEAVVISYGGRVVSSDELDAMGI